MSWGNHPDTLAIARAQGEADRSGNPEQSLEWLKAFRQAYERVAQDFGNDSLKEYLAALDRLISERGGV